LDDKRIISDAERRFDELFKKPSVDKEPIIWSIIMKIRIKQLSTAMITLLVVFAGIHFLGGSIDGTSTVFAEICNKVYQSGTISFVTKMKSGEDFVATGRVYEKDGHLVRTEFNLQNAASFPFPFDIMLMDTKTGKGLCMDSKRRVAWVSGVTHRHAESSVYDMFTNFQDKPDYSIKKLATKTIGDKAVQGFRLSKKDDAFGSLRYDIWADTHTNLPILVEVQVQTPQGESIEQIVTDIVFNEPLEDSLFDFSPEGYTIEQADLDPRVNRMKSAVQMNDILKACRQYVQQHNGQWPEDLSELHAYGIGPETFSNPRRIGKVGYCYIKPSGTVSETTVVLHEGYDEWLDGINVGYADFHVQFVKDEASFKASYEAPRSNNH